MSRAVSSAGQWRRIVREQQTGGLSVAAFCRRARIPQSSFYAWQRRLRDAASFVEVKLPAEAFGARKAPPDADPATVAAASEIELRLPGRRCVVVRPGFDRQTLRELLATLESAIDLGTWEEGASGVERREAGA